MKNIKYNNINYLQCNLLPFTGKIEFDPKDKTKKHATQSSWKKMSMIMFDSDITEYYCWLLEKRYNLKLNKPIRGPHISFINDSIRDMKNGSGVAYDKLVLDKYEQVKKKWDGKKIDVILNLDVRSDGKHWWLVVQEENRELIHSIRAELGLGRPHWGLHMSIGYANEKNIEHSKYILENIRKFGINYV